MLFSCLILCIVLKYGVTHMLQMFIVQCSLLQKRVIRLLCGVKRLDHTNALFHNVQILEVPHLVKLKTAIIMFRAYRYTLPMNVQLFRIHEPLYSSRHTCKFKQTYARTNLKSMCK